MQWPQITMIVLYAMSAGMAMVQHGAPKGNHSIWWTLAGIGLSIWLLTSGGFFK